MCLVKPSHFNLLILVVFLAAGPAAGGKPDGKYQEARNNYYSLLSSPERIKDRGEWLRAIYKFKASLTGSSRAADTLYTMGLLYENMYKRFHQEIDAEKALETFAQVTQKYPSGALAAAAERHVGDIRFMQRKYTSAEKSYSSAHKRLGVKSASYGGGYKGARITGIKRFSKEGYTRFIIHLSEKTAFRADQLKNPDRVFVDLMNTQPDSGVPLKEDFGEGMVRAFRLGKSANITRVVFDMSQRGSHSITALSNPSRLVVDFGRHITSPAPAAPAVSSPGEAPPAANPDIVQVSVPPAPAGGGTLKTIVIDHGHGGRDPGAIGPTGLKEKTVTLAVARKTAAILREKLGVKVLLTREGDAALELDDRTVMANAAGADLFVSIHANSSKNRRAAGSEAYFLSPARSADELETAARENMIANLSEDPAENDIAYIMSDMQSAQKINESALLARTVQAAMARKLYLAAPPRGKAVKQAMFYVLWRATMPSILVETDFISNPRQEKLMRDERYLDAMAESIARGIMDYSASYQVAMNN